MIFMICMKHFGVDSSLNSLTGFGDPSLFLMRSCRIQFTSSGQFALSSFPPTHIHNYYWDTDTSFGRDELRRVEIRSGGSSRDRWPNAVVKSDSFHQPSKNLQEVTFICTTWDKYPTIQTGNWDFKYGPTILLIKLQPGIFNHALGLAVGREKLRRMPMTASIVWGGC